MNLKVKNKEDAGKMWELLFKAPLVHIQNLETLSLNSSFVIVQLHDSSLYLRVWNKKLQFKKITWHGIKTHWCWPTHSTAAAAEAGCKKIKKEFNPDFYVFVWEQNISVLSLIVTAPVQYRSEIMVHLHPFQKGVIKLHFLQQNRNLLPTFRRSAAFRSIRPCEVH